jgi:hypothetical protein
MGSSLGFSAGESKFFPQLLVFFRNFWFFTFHGAGSFAEKSRLRGSWFFSLLNLPRLFAPLRFEILPSPFFAVIDSLSSVRSAVEQAPVGRISKSIFKKSEIRSRMKLIIP